MSAVRLGDCRVLEVGSSPAGAYAGKLFADLGAEVVKIEPPGGDPLRLRGAAGGESSDGRAIAGWSHPACGPLFAYLCGSKRSLVLDLEAEQGRRELSRLAALADVLIESAAPGPFDPISATFSSPRLVRAWISPFGRVGPYRAFRSNELTDDALSGHLALNGERHREPLARPGLHAAYQAGAHAFIGAVAALLARARTGRGQTVEVTHLRALATLHQYTTVMWTHARHRLGRDGNRQGGHYHPVGSYPCKDGWVCLAMPIADMLLPFLEEAGLHDVASDPRFVEDFARGQHKDELDAAIAPWLREHTVAEVVEIGLRANAPIGPVLSTLDVLADPHHAARGFFRPVRVGDREWLYPRGPFRIAGVEPRLGPPPELGEANRRGIDWQPRTPEEEKAAEGSPAASPDDRARRDAEADAAAGASERTGAARAATLLADGPLTGLRVLDLTRVWAGPLAARLLGDLGADVVKIEAAWARGSGEVPAAAGPATHLYPEDDVGERPWNRELSFLKLNRNKRGVTLELDRPRGRELFLRLAETADVVIENFTPRVMGKLGLDPAALHAVNPGLVCVSMPGFGSSGPYRDWLAFGPLIEAMSGLMAQMGYADAGPIRSGLAWPDPVTALHAASATLAALCERECAPGRRGSVVEVPMIESMICFLGEEVLAAQARGSASPRRGNRHAERAPQGVYPCAGEDRWIAISVASDDEWRALCAEAGLEGALAGADLARRQRMHDEIDRALAAWTARQDAEALMHRLQARGVMATVVADPERLVADPQLAHDDFWVELEHAEVGRRRYPGIGLSFSETPATFRRAAPCLGQHNAEVLGAELGLSAEELQSLEAEGIIADRPPPGASFRRMAKRAAAAQPKS